MTRLRSPALLIPVLLVLGIAGYAVYLIAAGGDGHPTDPVDIAASEPEFATFTELAEASDRVVHGEVVTVEDGRALTDPADPTAGVRTQLASLAVDDVRKGSSVDALVVEQEATLLDGTPITVNGVAPLQVGDTGWLFLIDGESEEFPYTALTVVDGFVADGSARADEVAAAMSAVP